MRVIYLVRAAQLLVTLRAIWMLYSVSAFCERTHHTMAACNDMIARIPMATPEQIEEHLRIKQQRAASNRPPVKTNTSSPLGQSTPATAHAAPIADSSTVPSSSAEVKKRVKREERRELPGNGMTEAQSKAAATVVSTKKEEEKMEGKKEGEEKKKEGEEKKKEGEEMKKEGEEKKKEGEEKKEEGEEEKKKEGEEKKKEGEEKKKEGEEKKKEEREKEVKKEEKKEEVKVEETTPEPSHAKTDDKKEQKEVQKSAAHLEVKAEVKTEEVKIEEKKEKTIEPKEKKEHAGAKVEIPVVATTTQKHQKDDDIKADHAPAFTSGDDKHHTVKKDLKVHVQEPVKVEETKKESNATPPKLAPAQQRFVLEHAETFLQEVRCLEVTSDAYFGKDVSPFAEHLMGLAFVGPILVVIAVYLVCTVMRTRLSTDHPSEFTQMLGCIFHTGMWMVVGLSMFFIYNHWTDNWHAVSANTFAPDFPCAWTNLIMLASFMMMATSVETWFHKRLHYDIVIERSYRCYEVIDNSEEVAAGQNQASHFSRTNVY